MLIINIVQTKLFFLCSLKENNNFLNKINDDKFSVADSVIFIQGNWIQMYENDGSGPKSVYKLKRQRICNRVTNSFKA